MKLKTEMYKKNMIFKLFTKLRVFINLNLNLHEKLYFCCIGNTANIYIIYIYIYISSTYIIYLYILKTNLS